MHKWLNLHQRQFGLSDAKAANSTPQQEASYHFYQSGEHCGRPSRAMAITMDLLAMSLMSPWLSVRADEPERQPTPAPTPPTTAQTTAAYAQVDDFRGRPRLLALNDFGPDDNDNQQYLVRLLLYSNEIDIEGIIPTTSIFQPDSVRPDHVFPRIDAYAQVQPDLLKHAAGFPTADHLRKRLELLTVTKMFIVQ